MKQILILMLSLCIALSSCSKSDDSKPETKQTCKIASMEYIEAGVFDEKQVFTYDDKSRVTSVAYTGIDIPTATITYAAGKITVKTKDYQHEYGTDASDRIVKADDRNYKYNADGYLIEEKSTRLDYPFTRSYSYTDGNLVKTDYVVEETYNNTKYKTTEVITLEYSKDIAGTANPYLWLEYETFLAGYFGKASKNLVSKVTVKTTDFTNGAQTRTYQDVHTITYKKDDKGNVTSVIDVFSGRDGNYTNTINLSYECK